MYPTGNVLRAIVVTQNETECLNECNLEKGCVFWDFLKGNCRLLSNEGSGPVSGYDGAVSGKRKCYLINTGPKGIIWVRNLF